LLSLLGGVVGAVLCDCTTFPAILADTCGNGVVDPGEDCDSVGQGPGTQCGTTGSQACHLVCPASASGAAMGSGSDAGSGSGPTCPSGWGCGSDGICRQPSGAFQRIGSPITAGAWRVDLGDFDGNGTLDAMTRGKIDARGFSQIRVQYLDTTLAPQSTFVPAPLVGEPQIVDMNGDGRKDVVFGYADVFGIIGVGVMTGNADATMTQVPYPVIQLPGEVRYYAVPFDDGGYNTCAYNQNNGATNLLDLSPSSAKSPPTIVSLASGASPPTLVGGFVLAPVFVDPTQHPCDNIVFAYGGAMAATNEVNVVSPCMPGAGDNWGDVSIVSIAIETGYYIPRAPQVADVDGDGLLDVLVPVTKPMAPSAQTAIAYNNGHGGFGAQPGGAGMQNLARELLQGTSTLSDGGTNLTPMGPVIATGDLNGDGVADFVVAGGIFLSRGKALPYAWSVAGVDHDWTDAVVADFNRDGALDVFAGNATIPDLDFFAGAKTTSAAQVDGGVDGGGDAASPPPANALSQAFVPTSGGVSHFSSGDFDGDGTNDLAFSQIDATGDGSDDIEIIYGSPFQFPGAPVAVGRFASVQQTLMVPASASEPLSLVVVSSPVGNPPNPVSLITYLPSTGARPPLSSFVLNTTSASGTTSFGDALAFVAAPFTAGAFPDVAAIAYEVNDQGNIPASGGTSGTTDTWVMPTSGTGAQFGAPVLGPAIPSSLVPDGPGARYFSTLMASADVNHDGIPESIVVGPASCGPNVGPVACAQSGNGTLLVGTYDATTQGFSYASDPLPGIVVSQQGQLAVTDVDGDGSPDIVLLSGSIADAGGSTNAVCQAARSLWVLWNDGSGGFSIGNAVMVVAGTTGCNSPRAFTLLRRDPSLPPAIVYVTRSTARYVALGPSRALTVEPIGSQISQVDPANCCNASSYSGDEYTGVGGGDIDGDGVDDFILVNNGDLYVYQGVPKTNVAGAP
jgi:hypothetical protein